MHLADDALGPDTLRRSLKPAVDESLEAETLRAPEAHDGHLRAAVHEYLQRMAVHLHVHVEHDDGPERLGRRLHGVLVVFVDVLESDRLLDLTLRLHIERVGVEQVDLSLARSLGPIARLVCLTKQRLHLRRVGAEDGGVEGGLPVRSCCMRCASVRIWRWNAAGSTAAPSGPSAIGLLAPAAGRRSTINRSPSFTPLGPRTSASRSSRPLCTTAWVPDGTSVSASMMALRFSTTVSGSTSTATILSSSVVTVRSIVERGDGAGRFGRRGDARRGEARRAPRSGRLTSISPRSGALCNISSPDRTRCLEPRVPKRAPHNLQSVSHWIRNVRLRDASRSKALSSTSSALGAPPLDALASRAALVADRPGASPTDRVSTRTSFPRSPPWFSSPSVAPPSPWAARSPASRPPRARRRRVRGARAGARRAVAALPSRASRGARVALASSSASASDAALAAEGADPSGTIASSSPAPATAAPPPPVEEVDYDAEERAALVRKLLVLAAASSRGQQDTRDSRAAAEDVVTELEFLNPTDRPAAAVDGEWVLVYANVEAFRSSPFFWGFQKMLPGGEELANSMFKFTAGLPVAGTRGPFGVISQTMSLETEELASEVEMKIFDPFFGLASGVGGTVVSTANVKVKGGEDGPGDVLLVTPRTTRVRNSNVGGALLDQLVVPTSELMSQASGGAAVEAEATVTYVDDSLRIMRVGEKMDQIFVYTRKSEMDA